MNTKVGVHSMMKTAKEQINEREDEIEEHSQEAAGNHKEGENILFKML